LKQNVDQLTQELQDAQEEAADLRQQAEQAIQERAAIETQMKEKDSVLEFVE
jgi:phage shock protein A